MVPVPESHDVTLALKYGVAASGLPMIETMRPTGVNDGLLAGGAPFRDPHTSVPAETLSTDASDDSAVDQMLGLQPQVGDIRRWQSEGGALQRTGERDRARRVRGAVAGGRERAACDHAAVGPELLAANQIVLRGREDHIRGEPCDGRPHDIAQRDRVAGAADWQRHNRYRHRH